MLEGRLQEKFDDRQRNPRPLECTTEKMRQFVAKLPMTARHPSCKEQLEQALLC